jgi:hypothetical protein
VTAIRNNVFFSGKKLRTEEEFHRLEAESDRLEAESDRLEAESDRLKAKFEFDRCEAENRRLEAKILANSLLSVLPGDAAKPIPLLECIGSNRSHLRPQNEEANRALHHYLLSPTSAP